MKFCDQCGNEMRSEQDYCESCGAKQEIQDENLKKEKSTRPKSKKKLSASRGCLTHLSCPLLFAV